VPRSARCATPTVIVVTRAPELEGARSTRFGAGLPLPRLLNNRTTEKMMNRTTSHHELSTIARTTTLASHVGASIALATRRQSPVVFFSSTDEWVRANTNSTSRSGDMSFWSAVRKWHRSHVRMPLPRQSCPQRIVYAYDMPSRWTPASPSLATVAFKAGGPWHTAGVHGAGGFLLTVTD